MSREIFKEFVGTLPSIPNRKPHGKTKIIYKSIAFKTLRFPCFNFYYDLFYVHRIKSIPLSLEKYFTEISFAYFRTFYSKKVRIFLFRLKRKRIMDDGYFFNGGICLCSESYTFEDQKILIKILNIKFNLNSYLIKRNKTS